MRLLKDVPRVRCSCLPGSVMVLAWVWSCRASARSVHACAFKSALLHLVEAALATLRLVLDSAFQTIV